MSLLRPGTVNAPPSCCVSELLLQQPCGQPSHRCIEPGCCPLGRWLDSEAAQPYRQYPAFQQLRSGHQALHEVASELILLQELGRTEDAASLHAGEFSKLRHHMQQRLLALKSLS